MLVDRVDGTCKRAMDVASRVTVTLEVGLGGGVHFAERDLDQPVDHCALVREVEVDGGPADECAPGDPVDRDPLVGLLAHRLARCGKDRFLGGVARVLLTPATLAHDAKCAGGQPTTPPKKSIVASRLIVNMARVA